MFKNFRILILLQAILLFLAAGTTVISADQQENPKIAFIHLSVDSSGYKILDVSVSEGALKQSRKQIPQDELVFEAVGFDSQTSYSGSFENPLIKRFEYEDPDNPGEIKSKTVELNSGELTIRIPFPSDLRELKIYRQAASLVSGIRQTEKKLVASFQSAEISGKIIKQ